MVIDPSIKTGLFFVLLQYLINCYYHKQIIDRGLSVTDKFESHQTSLNSPAYDGAAITPSDVTDYTDAGSTVPRALYIGTSGDVAVVTTGGTSLTFVGMHGWLPVRCKQVLSTGTTASDIVGVW